MYYEVPNYYFCTNIYFHNGECFCSVSVIFLCYSYLYHFCFILQLSFHTHSPVFHSAAYILCKDLSNMVKPHTMKIDRENIRLCFSLICFFLFFNLFGGGGAGDQKTFGVVFTCFWWADLKVIVLGLVVQPLGLLSINGHLSALC